MDNLNDLKKIWLGADTSGLPGTQEMMRIISHYRRSRLLKKAALILLAALFTGIMVAVIFMYKSQMVTTRIGEICIIAAGSMLVFTNIRSLGRLYRVSDSANVEFLRYLIQVKANRIYYHKKTQVAGLLLISVGLLLYVYEAVHTHLLLCIAAYASLIIYLIVTWFIVRPRVYKRQAKELEETINKMKHLTDQS